MQVIKRITCAALACAMLLGNTAYAADYEETSASEAPIRVQAKFNAENVSGSESAAAEPNGAAPSAADENITVTCSAAVVTLAAESTGADASAAESADISTPVVLMSLAAPAEAAAAPVNTVAVSEMLEALNDSEADARTRTLYRNLGQAFGLGADEEAVKEALQKMDADYQSRLTDYEEYLQNPTAFETPVAEPVRPCVEFDGSGLRLEKTITDTALSKNPDGTYTESASGETVHAAKTELVVSGDAAITLFYEGDTPIAQTFRKENPTDFVITLDCSVSMAEDGKYDAMVSALRVLLNQIMADEDNTVSIVCWASAAAVVEVDGKRSFSAADGITVDAILQGLYQPNNSGTCPDTGLSAAMNMMQAPNQKGGRNNGVLLFTDGQATGLFSDIFTRGYEEMLAGMYDAKIVNVTIGDEADTAKYETYLNPTSPNYQFGSSMTAGKDAEAKRRNFIDHVSYYNIPKLTDQELADKITEVFATALTDMITEKRDLHTTTITNGVLAAVGAGLLDEIPAGFEVVEVDGYVPVVVGTDESGKTLIEFPIAEDVTEVDYFVLPREDGSAVAVNPDFSGSEATLVAAPLNVLTATSRYEYRNSPAAEKNGSIRCEYVTQDRYLAKMDWSKTAPASNADISFRDWYEGNYPHIRWENQADKKGVILRFVSELENSGIRLTPEQLTQIVLNMQLDNDGMFEFCTENTGILGMKDRNDAVRNTLTPEVVRLADHYGFSAVSKLSKYTKIAGCAMDFMQLITMDSDTPAEQSVDVLLSLTTDLLSFIPFWSQLTSLPIIGRLFSAPGESLRKICVEGVKEISDNAANLHLVYGYAWACADENSGIFVGDLWNNLGQERQPNEYPSLEDALKTYQNIIELQESGNYTKFFTKEDAEQVRKDLKRYIPARAYVEMQQSEVLTILQGIAGQ